jgi:hypothetical protein
MGFSMIRSMSGDEFSRPSGTISIAELFPSHEWLGYFHTPLRGRDYAQPIHDSQQTTKLLTKHHKTMGKPTGFKEFTRQTVPYRDPVERAGDFLEIYTDPVEEHLRTQGARCMDCGVPFCQSNTGCPIDNLIPDWNDLIYQGRWKDALDRLH